MDRSSNWLKTQRGYRDSVLVGWGTGWDRTVGALAIAEAAVWVLGMAAAGGLAGREPSAEENSGPRSPFSVRKKGHQNQYHVLFLFLFDLN